MTAILEQLGLDSTFFVQLVVFFFLFLFLGQVFFKPFLRLLEERHGRTVKDRETADAMVSAATAKLEEYQTMVRLAQEMPVPSSSGLFLLQKQRRLKFCLMRESRLQSWFNKQHKIWTPSASAFGPNLN